MSGHPPIVHGTANAYQHYDCRCSPCTEAHRQRQSRYHASRRERRVEIDGRMVSTAPVTHGRHETYTNWACRCVPCRDAASAARQLRRAAS